MSKEVIVRTEPDRIRELLQAERDELKLDVISPGVAPTKLAEVDYGMNVDIAGIVRQINPRREFQRKDGSDGQVRNIRIQDATADMRCALWGEFADLDLSLGDPVLIRNAKIQDGWQDDIEASVGYDQDIEILDELEIEFVTIRLRGAESGSEETEDSTGDTTSEFEDAHTDDILSTMDVLERLRDELAEDDMVDEVAILNEAHYLIQEYGVESEVEADAQ